MVERISVTVLARDLSDILNRVRTRGETFVIEQNGEAVATIAPARPVPSVTLKELADRLGDVPLPDDGFANDLEAVQNSQPQADATQWRN